MQYKTCTHIYDDGHTCGSAAATDRGYCASHLRYRARQLRIAQVRARAERFDLKLPPIESMSTVVSALNQIVEAVAADMLDLKRADFLLKTLRFAAQALKSSDKWQPSIYQTDVPSAVIDLEAEYGLPKDINLATPPEVAFPPPVFSDLSSRAQAAAAVAGVEGPLSSLNRPGAPSSGSSSPSFDDRVRAVASPTADWQPDVANIDVQPDYPITPEMLEIDEVYHTVGPDAATIRIRELQSNRHRRELRSNRKRFADLALHHNIRLAAEKLVKEKLASGCTIPPAVRVVETFSDTNKKPSTSDTRSFAQDELVGKEA